MCAGNNHHRFIQFKITRRKVQLTGQQYILLKNPDQYLEEEEEKEEEEG